MQRPRYRIECTFHNFGPEPTQNAASKCSSTTRRWASKRSDGCSRRRVAVRFVHRFPSAGAHTVTIRTSGDRLELDNSRSLVVPVRSEIRVLCVAGREGAAKYLANALEPNPGGDSPIRPIIISEGDLAEAKLTDFDCVFLCNVAQLTATEADRLARYAEKGGGVVFFLGDRVMPNSYNTFAVRQSKNVIEPGQTSKAGQFRPSSRRIGELIAQPQFGLDPLEYRHPIVAPFRGRERAGLLTTPVARYYRLDVSHGAWRRSCRRDARRRSVHRYVAIGPWPHGACRDRWLAFVRRSDQRRAVDQPGPRGPAFCRSSASCWPTPAAVSKPLATTCRRAVNWLDHSGNVRRIEWWRTANDTARWARCTCLDTSTTAGWDWSYTDTDVSGVYSLRGLPQGRTQKFAVNVDAAEGDLAKIDPQQLPPEMKVRSTWQDVEGAHAAASVVSQSAWKESFLWVALALLFAESFMAWQFGRGAL